MTWAKVDDRANEHPKQLKAGPKACWLWVCGLMYCNRQAKKTGRIPKTVVDAGMLFPGLGAKDATKLINAELWGEAGDYYVVHEYESWNPEKKPRRDPEELSAIRAEAGRLGGRRSGEARREANEANEASTKQNTEPIASDDANQVLASRTAAPAYAHSRALDPPHPTPPQERDPPTPLNGKPANRFDAAFVAPVAAREDVQRVHTEWLRVFRMPPNTPLVVGWNTEDAERIAAAIDAHGEPDCVAMLRHAPSDGMVSGREDERGAKHESIRYLFGANLPRLIRDAKAVQQTRVRGKASSAEIERRKREE